MIARDRAEPALATSGTARMVERAMTDVLFRRPDPDLPEITAASFLRAVHRVAAALPDAPAFLNLCADRAGLAIGFAAAALRGTPCLLAPDRSPAALAMLRARYPGARTLGDAAAPDQIVVTPEVGDAIGREPDNPALSLADIVALGSTSGSTGTPAIHAKSWGALVARSRAAGERFGLFAAPGRVVVATVPPAHMYGFETTVLLPLHVPVASWCGCPFYPVDVAAALAQVPASAVLVTTPMHLGALLDAAVRLPPFAAAISATAPLDPALAARAEAAWGVPVLEIFGATEVGSIASRRTIEGEVWTLYHGVEARPAAEGEDGAWLTAPGMAPSLLPDRLLLSGGGRFRLAGRVADLVKRGGRRASLAGLAQVLRGLDGVEDGAFVLLGETPEERPVAVAVAPGRRPEALLAALRARLDPAFVPRRVVLVERLPRDPLGKLPQAALRALCRGDAPGDGRPNGLTDGPVWRDRFVVPPDHPCLPGHFPGRPVLPAAVLLAEVATLAERALPGARVTGVVRAKFSGAVGPGDTVEVEGGREADRCAFTCRVGGRIVSRGLLRLEA